MVKRTQRPGPRPAPRTDATRPGWPVQGHSGEGSASALEVLRKLEQSKRMETRPADPHPDDHPLR